MVLGFGNVDVEGTMYKFLVIIAAAVLFTWYAYPQFADGQSLWDGLVAWYG